jgi:hypothetical protein
MGERKRILRRVMPRIDSRLLYIDHLQESGCALFKAACAFDLEGIVAKWARRPYRCDGVSTSWIKIKIKNPAYSHAEGRHELFERRNDVRRLHRGSMTKPAFVLREPRAP